MASNLDPIENAFQSTTKLIFGKSLSNFQLYEEWITKRIPKISAYSSYLSSAKTYMPNHYFFPSIPKEKVAAFEDLKKASDQKIPTTALDLPFKDFLKEVSKISAFIPDFVEGNNMNISETTVYMDSLNLFRCFDMFWCKSCAYTFSAFGEGLFGCYRIVNSKFLIHCYNIENVTASFEMDNARNCSNSLFCHNVENVHESMFCFNTKSKRYAIGNVEVGREKYLEIRNQFMNKLLPELESKKNLELDVYHLLNNWRT